MKSIEKKVSAALLKMIRARRAPAPALDSQVPSSKVVVPGKLREVRLSDFPQVMKLKQRGGLHADSIENWERLWQHNPHLRSSQIQRPMGWVLEADGEVVGYLGNIFLLYQCGGKTLTAVTAHGLVVDPPYRALGISLVAAFFRQKAVDLFISTSAIEAVGKIALAFKSSPIPQPDYDTALFWVLRAYPFARVLTQKLKLAPTSARIGSAVAAAAVAADKILRRCRPKHSTTFAVSEIGINEIGDDFQALWNGKTSESPLMLADRSPSALRWHFKIPGDLGSVHALCCYRGQELVGYAIVRNDKNQETGLCTSLIADLIARNDDPEIIRTLLAAAYDYAKRNGSHILEMLGFPPNIRNVSAEWHPYRRKYPACPFYFKAAGAELHESLSASTAWYASPFDGDATLIRPSYSTPPQLIAAQERKQDSARKMDFEPEHSEVV